jgi:hypothetical protein
MGKGACDKQSRQVATWRAHAVVAVMPTTGLIGMMDQSQDNDFNLLTQPAHELRVFHFCR